MTIYLRHFEKALLLLLVTILLGTAGYHFLEGWSFLDSLYMTVITVSTVGYSEIHSMNEYTKFFTILIIFSSVGIVGYLLGSLTQILIVGEIATLLGRKKLEKQIKKLSQHIIICGAGRVGFVICHELREMNIPLIVLESNPEIIEKLNKLNVLYLQRDAVEEESLIEAGIEQARGLVTTLPSDPDNVFITLSARSLNPELFIISRACQENSVKKLVSAGANRVVSPHQMGAGRMVHLITKPVVTDFLDSVLYRPEMPLEFGEIAITDTSRYARVKLGESRIRQEFDLMVIGIYKKEGHLTFNPNVDTIIEPSDTLIMLGITENLTRFNKNAQ